MPVFKINRSKNVLVRAEIGNGHSGGIAARLEVKPVGKGNNEVLLQLGVGSACVRKTLVVTGDILKGEEDPPPKILLTLFVWQEDPVTGEPTPDQDFPTEEDANNFDANGECIMSAVLTFI